MVQWVSGFDMCLLKQSCWMAVSLIPVVASSPQSSVGVASQGDMDILEFEARPPPATEALWPGLTPRGI